MMSSTMRETGARGRHLWSWNDFVTWCSEDLPYCRLNWDGTALVEKCRDCAEWRTAAERKSRGRDFYGPRHQFPSFGMGWVGGSRGQANFGVDIPSLPVFEYPRVYLSLPRSLELKDMQNYQ